MKKLFTLAALAGVAIGITKMATAKKEWSGLTEAEVRAKLDAKLAAKVPDQSKRTKIGDKVIEGMRKKGMLREADGGTGAAATTGDGTEGDTP